MYIYRAIGLNVKSEIETEYGSWDEAIICNGDEVFEEYVWSKSEK